jgi:sec-independent protein translocase protein TatB
MFDSVGWGETAMLLVLALFVVGPDRLPGLVADAARALRGVRGSLHRVTADLKQELGPELGDLAGNLRDLQPRSVVEGLLTEDGPARPPRSP